MVAAAGIMAGKMAGVVVQYAGMVVTVTVTGVHSMTLSDCFGYD